MVSRSRISPIRMQSGAWRSAFFSADLQALRVAADLALVDDRLLVGEQELDRVLDGQDVPGHLLVALVEHRGERGALAGAGGAHHQDQAALLEHELRSGSAGRSGSRASGISNGMQRITAAIVPRCLKPDRRKLPTPDRPTPTLSSPVSSSSSSWLGRQQLGQQLARLGVGERLVGELQELAVDLDQDRRAGREVDVGRALLGHQAQQRSMLPALIGVPFGRGSWAIET